MYVCINVLYLRVLVMERVCQLLFLIDARDTYYMAIRLELKSCCRHLVLYNSDVPQSC